MNRLFIAATIAASLVAATAADAAGQRKRMQQDRGMWSHGASMRVVGPPWAGPNQCFTDEGYGRFSPCDTSRR